MMHKTLALCLVLGSALASPLDAVQEQAQKPAALSLQTPVEDKAPVVQEGVVPVAGEQLQADSKGDLETANTFWSYGYGPYANGYYRKPYYVSSYGSYGSGLGGLGGYYDGWRRGGYGGYYGGYPSYSAYSGYGGYGGGLGWRNNYFY